MASLPSLLLLLLSLLTITTTTVTSIPDSDLQLMLAALRSRGYNLFGNAITISDIRHSLLRGPSFTLFAPTDGALFSLELNSSPSFYLSALRYHIVPGKYSVSDLLALRPGSTLPTLLPHHQLTVGTDISPASEVLKADGLDLVVPGLYYGRNIAVHGLNGILDHRYRYLHRSPLENLTSPDLEQISPEPQSFGDLKSSQPETLSPSPADAPISPAVDFDLLDYLPESRPSSSPEALHPFLESPVAPPEVMSPEDGEVVVGTLLPPLSSAPGSQPRQPSQCPDPGEGCGELPSELEEIDRFELESRCGLMMQGRIPARTQAFSPAPGARKINGGKDL